MASLSRYGRKMARLYSVTAVRPSHGSVNCGKCGRMVPAIDANGSYLCTCGNGEFVDAPPELGEIAEPGSPPTSAKR
jgi:hypothetical protein